MAEHPNSAAQEARRALAIDLIQELTVRHEICVENAERYGTVAGFNRWMGKAFGLRMAMEVINKRFNLTEREIWGG